MAGAADGIGTVVAAEANAAPAASPRGGCLARPACKAKPQRLDERGPTLTT
jgi:hypothetical protein